MTYIDKKAITNQRSAAKRSLRSASNKAEEARRNHARNLLNAAEAKYNQQGASVVDDTRAALLHATANMAHRVLGAFGVSVPINVQTSYSGPNVSACTDFRKIYITVNVSNVNIKDVDSVAEFISTTKGAVYHEGGHNKYTMPFSDLIDVVRGRVIVDSNNWEEVRRLQSAWNILEDQRMETAMATESPVLARYFTSIVLNVVINRDDPGTSWPYISGRKYLPRKVRKAILAEANAHDAAHLIPDINRVVDQYVRSNDPYEQWALTVEFSQLMSTWGTGISDPPGYGEGAHALGSSRGKHSDAPQPTEATAADDTDADDTPPASGGNGTDDDNDQSTVKSGAGQGDDNDDGGGDEQEPQSTATPQSGHGSTSHSSSGCDSLRNAQEAIAETIDSLKSEALRNHRAEALDMLAHINDDVRGDVRLNRTRKPMAPDDLAQSMSITNGIIGAIEHLVDNTSPTWQFRMETGVLDPTAFITRDPGDTDFWTDLDGQGDTGYDLSVSVLLDTSFSMEYSTKKLSHVAYAIRSACDHLDIKCTVNTFNSVVEALYRPDDAAEPFMVSADGGTFPNSALDMLPAQRYGAKRHLVVILTDGEWDSVDTLAPWEEAGRYFLLVGLNVPHSAIANKRANDAVVIWQISDLPALFTRSLAGFLA